MTGPHQQHDPLSSEKLQIFVAALAGLAPEEVRKAKSLFIRNAIAEYRAQRASLEGFRAMQGCFGVVPLFWPMLRAQRTMLDAQQRLARDRIRNAMEVWADDLRGEKFDTWDDGDPG